MAVKPGAGDAPTFVRDLMRGSDEIVLSEATENLKRYLAVALLIYSRLALQIPRPDSLETESRGSLESSNV